MFLFFVGVVCVYFVGSFCGGLGFVILIDIMLSFSEEVMWFVWVVLIVLDVRDWRVVYWFVGFWVGEFVVVIVIGGVGVKLNKK